MPWAVIEKFDDESGEEFIHIVPFMPVKNSFETREEALAFAAEREAADDCVTNEDHEIIGVHTGHTLTPDCACDPETMTLDPYSFIHRAAN